MRVKVQARRPAAAVAVAATVTVTVTARVDARAGPARPRKPPGLVLYRGPSLLDGSPVAAVATSLARRSKNPKTGDAVQTYILADGGEDPAAARRSGGDAAVCGDCPHRCGTCYVDLGKAPLAVYRALRAGRYPDFDPAAHLGLFRGRFVRVGSYGDPAAVPAWVWVVVCGVSRRWSGYTHAWRSADPLLARYCMASVDTPAQRAEAVGLGWRTFRVRLPGRPLEPGEFECPASAEAGRRLTCAGCGACGGSLAGGRNATPAVVFHGHGLRPGHTPHLFGRVVARLEAGEGAAGGSRRHALPTL